MPVNGRRDLIGHILQGGLSGQLPGESVSSTNSVQDLSNAQRSGSSLNHPLIYGASYTQVLIPDEGRGIVPRMLTGNFTNLYFMLPTTDLTHNTQRYFDIHTITVTNTYGSQTHLFTYTCKFTGLKIA
jgi:hypothetical protein